MGRRNAGRTGVDEQDESRLLVWALKGLVGGLFVLVLAMGAYEWRCMAGTVKEHDQQIDELQTVITKMQAYQEQDKTQQEQQTEILKKMLDTMQKEQLPEAGTR